LNQAQKRIALNTPAFPKSKLTMKSIHFNHRSRRFGLALLAGATLFGFAPGARAELSFVLTNAAPAAMPRRPNLILIVADGLGYGDLSCYGQTKFQTPNLDRLAAEGVRFTGYDAGAAARSPARAALLLGREPGHLQQRADVDVPLAADDITVAQALQQAGYRTGLIGEWNLGDESTTGAPWRRGFDEFAGYFDPNDAKNYYADYMWRYAPKAFLNPTNQQMEDFIGREMLYANTTTNKSIYTPDLLTKAALNFIKVNQPDQFNRYRPFFLLLNYNVPGAGTGQVPTDAPYSNEPWPQPEKNKAAMIARLDGSIGQLREQLQNLRMTNDTVIFFTSDTGPEQSAGIAPKFFLSSGSFRGGRGDLSEGGLRVPMIVNWPGKIRAGQASDFAWAAWDFPATAMDIARVKPPAGMDGLSVLPTLISQTQTNRHEYFHWSLRGRNGWHRVRMGNWEAVQPQAGAPLELYNLKADPGETSNVAEKNPDVIKTVQGFLKTNR
jgi:arylsulfatase A-like enzyme